MRIAAAVLVEAGRRLELADLELAPPKRDEVLVRLHASGICRSDLSLQAGKWPVPLPIVLGHEGAGVIESVGPGVPETRVGERVVLTFAPACGRCRFCLEGRVNLCSAAAAGYETGTLLDGTTRLALDGARVHHLAFVSSFATHAVMPAAAAIPIAADLDLALACLLGCGITTGVMAVTRRANVRPGESVAVFGCGGVGLAALQGARLVSAGPVVAVDPVPAKRELALRLGATDAVDPEEGDAADAVRALVPGGVDYAFEAIGSPTVVEQAFRSVRQGGVTVLIGQPAIGVAASFPVYDVTQFEHAILGTNLGGATPALHVPQLAALAASGRLDLASLVTHRFPLEGINEAMETTASGTAGRVVLDLL
jgi:S-(hydroxymethyl)glutathione dehydrogenase / alcohol dehydrogenase